MAANNTCKKAQRPHLTAAQLAEKNKKKLQASADQEYNALVKAADWAANITERVEIMESLTPDLEVTKEWLTSAKTLIGQTPDNLKAEMSQVVNDKGILLCPCYWPEECHSFFAWLNKRVKKAQSQVQATTVAEPTVVASSTTTVEAVVSTPVEYKPTNGFAKAVLASVVIADKQVAPVVSNLVKVSYNKPKANKNLTNTKADKFAPSAPSEVIEEAIPKASSDFLKDALRKAMYNAFYEEQSLALEGYYEASRSSIAARYEQQYKDYKLSLVDAINSVTVESNTIKAKAKQDVILAYEADEAKYEKDWQQWFEDNKSSAIDEVLQEVELPIDSSLVIALIAEAKEAEEAAKVVAVKEQTAKKLAAIDAYNNKQKTEAKQSMLDKHLASLAKAKKEIFYYSKVTTAQAAKAVVSNCSSVAKMNKEQAKQYLDLFLELQALVKKAKDVAGTKEFTAVLNAIYKVGSALSALYKTLSNELGYSFDNALENILHSNLQELNDVESVKSLSEKEKTNRRVIVAALDKLESK